MRHPKRGQSDKERWKKRATKRTTFDVTDKQIETMVELSIMLKQIHFTDDIHSDTEDDGKQS